MNPQGPPELLLISPMELTPPTLEALATNSYRYYATGVDGQVIFKLSRELRSTPPKSESETKEVSAEPSPVTATV